MSNVYELPERREPTDEAGDWIAKLDRGLGDQEETALRAWLAADPRHSAALLELAAVWDKAGSLSRLADLFPEPAVRRRRAGHVAFALAATMLLSLVSMYWATSMQRTGDPASTAAVAGAAKESVFQTSVGEHSTATLPDGSQITLNTDSLIRVRFEAHRRLLRLERGEVYVQVAHDSDRPFAVWVGNRFVEAVGTEFNVAITEDQRIELIVTEGKVLVGVADRQGGASSRKGPDVEPDAAAASEGSLLPVQAGERMVLDQDDGIVEPIEPEDVEVRLSWRGGNLVFRGESLAEALAEIERYTRVEFVIQDENLRKKRIIGMFRAGDVDGLLATLRRNFDIAYERVSDEKVILTDESAQ